MTIFLKRREKRKSFPFVRVGIVFKWKAMDTKHEQAWCFLVLMRS